MSTPECLPCQRLEQRPSLREQLLCLNSQENIYRWLGVRIICQIVRGAFIQIEAIVLVFRSSQQLHSHYILIELQRLFGILDPDHAVPEFVSG